MRIPTVIAALLATALPAEAQRDFFEQAPIRYSETEATDPMAGLIAGWRSGARPLPTGAPLDVLRAVLEALDVPPESQVLVFSRTSKQNNLIRPANPRALYFSSNAYVGYVPGGIIELAATDPVLGPVFYLLDVRSVGEGEWVGRDPSCLQCHATSRTELVPGLLVRSVFPDRNGHPILAAGTYLTTQSSPLRERWGGWYVTGAHGDFRHLGNTLATERDDGGTDFDYESGANLQSLADRFDLSKYLQPTSDIVALMVLEHQCQTQNLLTKAAMEYRRLSYLQKAIDSDADLSDPKGMTRRALEESAEDILRQILFCDEADLGEGVEGSDPFVKAFEAGGRKSSKGHSLRQLRLFGHLFRTRCSYMIHSTAFNSLPDPVRNRVLTRLREVLRSREKPFGHLGSRERQRILEIVSETVERLPPCWK